MKNPGIAGKLAKIFITSKLTPLIIAGSILLGIGAVYMLPREEEPQIIVPMIDVMVQMPGASPKEIEERVTEPMEKLLWEIPGVEYIYSTSSPGAAIATVRFETAPGHQMQIDFGQKRVRIGGEEVLIRLLVAVLSYSRRIFVKAFL